MAWRPSALLDAGTSVAVASTTTLLSGPHDVVGGQVCGIALTNQDASQTLEAWVEVSADGATWEAKAWSGLSAIAPNSMRYDGFSVSFEKKIRVRGTASGAGLTANIYMELFTE